jgi:chromosome segregation protein
VRSRWPHVERLLDGLLAHAVAVEGGWERALDVALAHPGLVVVTRDGDRFASTGWRAGASAHAATGAALDEARSQVEAWADDAARAAEALGTRRAEVAAARAAVAELARRRDGNDARLGAARGGLERLEAARQALVVEDAAVGRHLAEVQGRLRRDAEQARELEAALPGLEAEEEAAAQRDRELRRMADALDQRAAQLAARRTALEVETGRAEQRRALISQRLADIDGKLADHAARRAEAHDRRLRLDRLAIGTERLAGVVSARLAVLDAALARLHDGRRRQQEAARVALARLADLRGRRAAAEEELESHRERARQAELDEAEVRLRLGAAEQAVTRELGVEVAAAKAAPCPDLPDGTSPSSRRRQLERELSTIGPVNPLALEEHDLLQERHGFLEAQLEDVRSARRDLARVIRAVDREIVEVFSAAHADVSENFAHLFSVLFPGGTGRLRLTDPDDLLNTGIEVEARPSGKNVRKLSLLSGGERALTALAFLFAVFRSRPSPFYLLDEVEAALDDVNLHRFLGLIEEFRKESQLLVVTHQKRTMEAADCLYGVTLQPGGSSKVVSERVRASA